MNEMDNKKVQKLSEAAAKKAEQAFDTTRDAVVRGYKAVETGTVQGYKAVENAVVGAYTKIEDTFVDRLFKRDGETTAEAKARLRAGVPGNGLSGETAGDPAPEEDAE